MAVTSGRKCAPGCTCGRHAARSRTAAQLARCEVGCTCGRHPAGYSPSAKRRDNRTAEDRRKSELKFAHRMTVAEWDALWTAQAGRCCYCQDPLSVTDRRQVHVDHDHSCCPPGRSCASCRRGLACRNCNIAVGHALDDPERLERIAASLRRLKDAALERLAEEVTVLWPFTAPHTALAEM